MSPWKQCFNKTQEAAAAAENLEKDWMRLCPGSDKFMVTIIHTRIPEEQRDAQLNCIYYLWCVSSHLKQLQPWGIQTAYVLTNATSLHRQLLSLPKPSTGQGAEEAHCCCPSLVLNGEGRSATAPCKFLSIEPLHSITPKRPGNTALNRGSGDFPGWASARETWFCVLA